MVMDFHPTQIDHRQAFDETMNTPPEILSGSLASEVIQ
jgi:hypothetical protein